jgi:hypothetical protein
MPIAIGIDFSKNLGYSLLEVESGDLSTIYTRKLNSSMMYS